jgi:hypothetical protein
MKKLYHALSICFMCILTTGVLHAEYDHPFSVGEKITYKIYGAGLHLGNQEVELRSIENLNGKEVYRLYGRTWGTRIVNLFYHLDDKWMVFIDRETLLPVKLEKTIWEGKEKGFVEYEIDQENHRVVVKNITKNKEDVHEGEYPIFDVFTLAYFYRYNHEQFDEMFTFDFLETNGLLTSQFKNEGLVDLRVSTISKSKALKAFKMKQVGGVGIEIYVSADELRLPLRLVSNAELPRDKKLVLEMYLTNYTPGEDHGDIPVIYKEHK